MVIVFTAFSSPSPCPPLFLSEPAPEAINIQLELNCDCISTFPFYLPRAGFFSGAGRGAGILLLSSHAPRAGRTEPTGQHHIQQGKERFVFCMFYVVAASVPVRKLQTHFMAASWSRSVLSVGPALGGARPMGHSPLSRQDEGRRVAGKRAGSLPRGHTRWHLSFSERSAVSDVLSAPR